MIGRSVMGLAALALLVLAAAEASAFSGFKGRFQGRCDAQADARVCGVRVDLPDARNGERLEGGGQVFVCRNGRWRVEGGGRSCCPARTVEVCGVARRLPVAEAGRERNLEGGDSREERYVCDGEGWQLDEREVWGLCAPAPEIPGMERSEEEPVDRPIVGWP